MIEIAIVDDHPLVRRGLREVLSAERDMRVIGEASRPEQVGPLLAAHRVDVLLLDLILPGRGGLELLEDLLREWPTLRALILSTHVESPYAVRSIQAGAAGYVSKSAAPSELVTAIRTVAATGQYISASLATQLAEAVRRQSRRTGLEALSDRECEVLRLIAAGESAGGIADRLALSVKTVSTYRVRLLQKLDLKSSADLIRFALEHGLTE